MTHPSGLALGPGPTTALLARGIYSPTHIGGSSSGLWVIWGPACPSPGQGEQPQSSEGLPGMAQLSQPHPSEDSWARCGALHDIYSNSALSPPPCTQGGEGGPQRAGRFHPGLRALVAARKGRRQYFLPSHSPGVQASVSPSRKWGS